MNTIAIAIGLLPLPMNTIAVNTPEHRSPVASPPPRSAFLGLLVKVSPHAPNLLRFHYFLAIARDRIQPPSSSTHLSQLPPPWSDEGGSGGANGRNKPDWTPLRLL